MSSENPPTYFDAIKLDPIYPTGGEENPTLSPSAPLLPRNEELLKSNILDDQLRHLANTLKFTTGSGNAAFYIRDTVDCLILKGELCSGESRILSIIDVTNRTLFTIKTQAVGQGSKSIVSNAEGRVLEMIGLDASTIKIKDIPSTEYSVTLHGDRDRDIVIAKLHDNHVLAKIHIPHSGIPATAFEATMVFQTDQNLTGLDKCLSLAVPMVYMLERSKVIQTVAAQTAVRVSDDKMWAALCIGLIILVFIGIIIWLIIATNKPECERKPWLSKCSGRG